MSSRRRDGVFTGAQTAGVINNIAGDQLNYGGVQGTIGELRQGLADVETITQLLRQVPLTADDRDASAEAIDRLREELAKPKPSQPTAARALEDLTTILKSAGALAGAGIALVDPIGRIALAIGGAAAAVLKSIGR